MKATLATTLLALLLCSTARAVDHGDGPLMSFLCAPLCTECPHRCCDDYRRKPLPWECSKTCGGYCDNYCRKALPWDCPQCRYCCDDYCPKRLPCVGCGCERDFKCIATGNGGAPRRLPCPELQQPPCVDLCQPAPCLTP